MATEPGEPWPSPARAWYATGVLAVVLMCNFLDRSIMYLLIEPIKHDLGLSDFEVSLLIGFAFVCFYAVLGLPIARLVDVKSRRAIVAFGVASWSAMTALCGAAHSFLQLFLCRIGVGVGEACNGPATFSLLADYFPKEKLPKAIAVLNFGYVTGTGLALITGGAVIHFAANTPLVTLPVIGTVHSWQITFFVVGLPGLAVAALMATVREPVRRGRLTVATQGTQPTYASLPVSAVFRFVLDNWRTVGPMFLGVAVGSMLAIGNQTWIPTMFMRTYGWTAPEVGVVQGLILLIVWPFGLLTGSAIARRYSLQGRDDANMRVTVISQALYVPLAILMPLMPTATLALAALALGGFVAAWSMGPQSAALQVIAPNEMRGQVTALFLFIINVVGFGVGPTFVAVFTDYVFGSEGQLRYAMATAAAFMGPLTVLILWSGIKPYAASVARARAWS